MAQSRRNRPKVARTAKNSKKRMFCIFFSVDGIIASIVIEKGQTITGDYYAKIILPTMFKKFMEISGRSTVRDVMLHHDNAAPHKSKSSLSTFRKNESYCSPTLLTVLIWHHATSFYFQKSKNNLVESDLRGFKISPVL